MITWTDKTMYMRGEIKTPSKWEMEYPPRSLRVEIRKTVSGYSLYIFPLFQNIKLKSKDLESAQVEAVQVLRVKIAGLYRTTMAATQTQEEQQ